MIITLLVVLVGCGGANLPTAVGANPVSVNRNVALVQDSGTPAELCATALPAADPANRSFSQAEQVLEADADYFAILCTSAGPVFIDLFETDTPVTVNNFVFLAQQGFFNNTTFHRVIADFMAQGGDPTATGTGGPGYRFQDEFVGKLRFDGPGKLAMANSGPATNGSQFFVTTVPTPHLNDAHTIFGQVVEGQANVESIELRDPASATGPGTALQTVLILTDRSLVELSAKEPPTQAEVETALDQINTIITPDVAELLEAVRTSQATDAVLDAAPEAARALLQPLLETYNHQYRVSGVVNNKACDLASVQFMSVGYALDAFASPDDAAGALADPTMAQIPLVNGFSTSQVSDNLPYPYFTGEITACDQPATRAMTYYQRGPFIITVEITIPTGAQGSEDLDRVLTEFVAQRIFEPFLADVLYRDIR
ncbi:MAG: peptidylprolyl isomerase [Anaerolineae bacterium]|nr:peptidylprolyl isomerase [Anaerolineae bacterium]